MLGRDTMAYMRQDQRDDELMHLAQIKNDTLWFSFAMQELVARVQDWLCGSGFRMRSAVIPVQDESIQLWPNSPPSYYNASTLLLRKQNLKVRIIPLRIYGEAGSRGRAILEAIDPNGLIFDRRYILSLVRDTSCWTIRIADHLQIRAVPLSKETFNLALSSLNHR
ncbi:hypothetical protein [Pantoea sp. GbtcB22]|uniref:hypothetical protein n=1 Tax=Pantoea sp. GbtcB22 TaxID=2824767 RepID=UPI001C2F7FAD|nr:hypothetical protein [Pantoea sp. GbtcB22]